ncbi:mechanosensitive ion channel family protein [Aquabacterium sp. OR-4]|uniref:mechanosensitive ion channel family protein n=1 Tax=Aquabacterium sp. OR-4 TaxID=2978127 RepID=UPI0028C79BFA|nr:mechanosensitive ion channel family protein [Aquabacterium sp. OR-4]MDT7835059.1 mechanosensitive ion channel family protein [Aquabacterium sp. OR-4]
MSELLQRSQRLFPGVDWSDVALALAAGLLVYLALSAGVRLAVQRLQRFSARTRTRIDDGLAQVLARTSTPLLMLVGALVALGMLPLDDRWHGRVSQLWFAVVALQLGLWGQQAVGMVLRAHHEQQAPGTALSASGTLMGWGLRGLLWLVVLMAVLSNMGVDITAFVASLGIGGIAIALAVQNVLGDLFASLAIAVDKPFEVGDAITVGQVSGTVEKVGLKTTRIRSIGGEQVVMSNAELLRQTVANFKRLQTRRVVFNFGITYDATADQVAEVPGIVRGIVEADSALQFGRAHFKGFGESSLDFEVVYRVMDPSFEVYMDRQQAVNLALMRALKQRQIDFAFPTRTVNLVAPPGLGGLEPAPVAGP